MNNEFRGKTILVTGGTGTIGSEIVRQLLSYAPKQLRVLSRDETRQYYLQEELEYPDNLRLLIGDIRDRDRLDLAFKGVDIIFHAAAMKHVPHCEYNPYEAVKTNILGSQNVIDMAIKHNVKKVIGISTDKAVNPSNVLGTSKLMMEKLFTNANYCYGKIDTLFSCVRFGNIAWSNGSVFPLWKQQAETKKRIRVTDKDMTRFFISRKEAINLVLRASVLSGGGEIFILKMKSAPLTAVAELFIKKYFPNENINIEIIGNRAGEINHEELFDKQDKYRKIFSDNEMFIIVPALALPEPIREPVIYPGFKEVTGEVSYSSEREIDLKKIEEVV